MKIPASLPDLFSNLDRNKLRTEFYDALSLLTADQKKAVEQIDGPLMVLAGPGTGKTQVLAARYGYILDQTDTHINQILCLTYTEAGVAAMRERLIQFIGPAAHAAQIYTYHAFCYKIIEENPEYFFDFKKFKLADKLKIYEIVEEIMNELPDDHAFKRIIGDKHFDIHRLVRLYDIIKKEELDVEAIIQKIRKFISEEMHLDDEYTYVKDKSRLKANYQADKSKFIRNVEALETFDRYVEKMHASRLLDYNDMLINVKNAFIKYPDLLAKYQESYLYFLVDEFQDTNAIQNSIMLSLCAYWDQPNLFVVGDDDQAIFRFQGADQQNLLTIIEKYPSLELICITENYRSTQNILTAANHIIENMPFGRISSFQLQIPPELFKKINKKLLAATPHPYDHPPALQSYVNAQQETLAVFEFIKNRWMESPASISDIAVIVRRNKSINELAYLLELEGIPINLKNSKDILSEPFIQHFILLLRYLHAEYRESQSGEQYLIQLMYLPYWRLNPGDVARIAFLERKTRLNKNLAENILNQDAWPNAIFEDKKSLETFILNTKRWIACLPPTKTLVTICEDILRSSGLMQWALRSKDRNWYLRAINSFLQFVQNESYNHPQITLETLLDKLKKMEDFDLSIPVEAGYTAEKGVNILTAHGAKGLEFETVWMMNVIETEWEKFGAANDTPYKLPKHVRQFDQTVETRMYDERRLFYVAMTRAKYNLIISWSTGRTETQSQNQSVFVTELSNYLKIHEHQQVKVSEELLSRKMQLIQNRNITPPAFIDHDLIQEYLKEYVMSVSNLNTYLDCPRTFYFEEILKVPKAPSAHQGLGLAVHEALHDFFFHALSQTDFDPTRLVSLFQSALKKNEWFFTLEEYQGLYRGFSTQLPLFLKEHLSLWKGIEKFKLEYYLDRVNVDGIPLTGRLDQIIIKDGQATIIDFKSGKGDSSSSASKLKKPWKGKNSMTQGGDYWRQGGFYKILLDHDQREQWTAQKSSMLFLQPNKLDPHEFLHHQYTYSADELLIIQSQIKETYENVYQHRFDTGCEKPECEWCTYLKTHQLITTREAMMD